MKKTITYILVAIILIFSLICLTGCGNSEQITNSEENSVNAENSEKVEVVTSGEYKKWPSGVYNAYGIPEYTYGEVVFAEPYSENGSVHLNTTITELRSYVNLLITKDFKINEENLTSLKEYNPNPDSEYELEKELRGTIYAPKEGAGYTISYAYRAKPYEGMIPANSFENITEDYEYEYNCSLYINIEEYPEENIESDLLTKYGLSNEEILPTFKIYEAEKNDSSRMDVVFMNMGYDSYHSEEEIKSYKLQLANAFEKSSDDSKIYDYSGESVISTDEEKKELNAFVYKYEGTDFLVVLEMYAGYSANMYIRIENK